MTPDPRYPIGKFELPASVTPELRRQAIQTIADTPAHLRAAVRGLTDVQLETPYREGGWTLRQTVHHVADSHINSYIRWRLALTEEQPPIKTYKEAQWAELHDAKSAPIEISLNLLDALHDRWTQLLRSLPGAAYAKTLLHPERGVVTLDWLLFIYAWHGPHHIAHITNLRRQKNW
jgi:uncharacterized damage-inducible protein DinB